MIEKFNKKQTKENKFDCDNNTPVNNSFRSSVDGSGRDLSSTAWGYLPTDEQLNGQLSNDNDVKCSGHEHCSYKKGDLLTRDCENLDEKYGSSKKGIQNSNCPRNSDEEIVKVKINGVPAGIKKSVLLDKDKLREQLGLGAARIPIFMTHILVNDKGELIDEEGEPLDEIYIDFDDPWIPKNNDKILAHLNNLSNTIVTSIPYNNGSKDEHEEAPDPDDKKEPDSKKLTPDEVRESKEAAVIEAIGLIKNNLGKLEVLSNRHSVACLSDTELNVISSCLFNLLSTSNKLLEKEVDGCSIDDHLKILDLSNKLYGDIFKVIPSKYLRDKKD